MSIRPSAAEARQLSQIGHIVSPRTREMLDQVYKLIETTARCTTDQKVCRPLDYFEGLSLTDISQLAMVLTHDGYIVTQEAGVMTIDWSRGV